MCFKSILKILHSNYLQFCSNLPAKFATSLKSSLLFNSFYCLFCLKTKLYDLMTEKLEKLWMRKLQCLLFVLKRSYICYYVICVTVSLIFSTKTALERTKLYHKPPESHTIYDIWQSKSSNKCSLSFKRLL